MAAQIGLPAHSDRTVKMKNPVRLLLALVAVTCVLPCPIRDSVLRLPTVVALEDVTDGALRTWLMARHLESRVSGPLGRHYVLVWAGCGRIIMLCYVMFRNQSQNPESRLSESKPPCSTGQGSITHSDTTQFTESEIDLDTRYDANKSTPPRAWHINPPPCP